ncbi:MAG: hypothetical protein DHS20C08_16470 [Rhodomicrobium sp.]|nr:MAG: hypothetical protein DHS20C08_16470 [Rhodomicrobium sp.]
MSFKWPSKWPHQQSQNERLQINYQYVFVEKIGIQYIVAACTIRNHLPSEYAQG